MTCAIKSANAARSQARLARIELVQYSLYILQDNRCNITYPHLFH